MKKLNITPGKWMKATNTVFSYPPPPCGGDVISEAPEWAVDSMKFFEDNATLIVDAGNTYHATGMLPSEMAERIKALEEALQECTDALMAVEYWRQMKHRNKSIHDPRLVIRVDPKYVWPQVKAAISDARAILSPINEAHGHLVTNPE